MDGPRRTLAILALSLAGAPAAGIADQVERSGNQLNANPTPLGELIAAMPAMADGSRLDLAAMLLEHVAAAYEDELGHAIADVHAETAQRRSRLSWYHATAPILAELRAAQARLEQAEQVDLLVDRPDQLLLLIDEQPLFVSWPRPSAQARQERELVAAYCQQHRCPGDAHDGISADASHPRGQEGSWTLSQLHPPRWETAGGLRCEFADYSDRDHKEARCRAAIAELHAVASALQGALRQGQRIEWQRVALDGERADGLQVLRVNGRGDFVALAIPTLAAGPVDWWDVRRWLQAQADDSPATATVLRAPSGN